MLLILGAGFFGLHLANNQQEYRQAIGSISAADLALGLLAGGCYWLSLAAAFSYLQRVSGGGLSFTSGVRLWSLSSVARYVPGNIWHIAGRSAMTVELGGNPGRVLAASVLEQLLTVFGAVTAAGLLSPLLSGGLSVWSLAVLGVPIAALIFHPGVQRAMTAIGARVLKRPAPEPLPPSKLALVTALYLLPNIFAGVALALTGRALGIGVLPSIAAFGIAWVVGYLSFLTPSGLGVRELTLAATLAGFGTPAEISVIALAHRVVLTISEIVLVGLIWLAGKSQSQLA